MMFSIRNPKTTQNKIKDIQTKRNKQTHTGKKKKNKNNTEDRPTNFDKTNWKEG